MLTEYMDNADHLAVEWAFALAKSKHGLGLITSKLDQTTRSFVDGYHMLCEPKKEVIYMILVDKDIKDLASK